MARWLALIAITQQVGCGGKVSTAATGIDPDPVAAVTISPSSAQISAGASVQFVVTVQNAANPAVTWEVNGVPGGNSSVGTIALAGANTASYTAPVSVATSLTVTVAAVLQADGVTTGSATVTVTPPSGPQVSVSPPSASAVIGASIQFTVSVQNAPAAVVWQVNNLDGGSSSFGTITSSGFYTAPAAIPNPATVTVTALLQSDLATVGTASVTIIATPAPVITLSPSTANVIAGQMLEFTAGGQSSNAALIWEVNGVPGGNLQLGTIASSGNYTANYSAPTFVPGGEPLTITAALETDSSVSGSAGVTVVLPGTFTGTYSWRNDAGLTGQNLQETMLTPSTVGGLQKLYGCPVDGMIYAQPLYVANVTVPMQGTFDVIYVATENDSLYAFNANSSSCQILWQASFINPAAGVNPVLATQIGSDDIWPQAGITGTPAINPTTATLYVVVKTDENGTYIQRLHALDLATGAEKFGGPAVIQARITGIGDGSVSGEISFNALTENQRSGLLLSGGNVYVAFDSYGDTDPFHGWLFSYNATNLAQAPLAVFNSTPNGSRGGIGQSGAALSSDGNGNIFAVTSDGTRDSNSDYAETLLRLRLNPSFTVADSFAPPVGPGMQLLGSTGVLLLPSSAGSLAHPSLAILGNESDNIYLLDQDHLAADQALQTLCLSLPVIGTPAFWTNNTTPTIYTAPAGGTVQAFPLANGAFNSSVCPSASMPSSQSSDSFNTFGASPAISANGSTAGIVWVLDTSGYAGAGGTSSPAILHAYDATNLANELYVSPANANGPVPPAGLAVKFAVPTVANGMVYVGTQTELSVFGLPQQ